MDIQLCHVLPKNQYSQYGWSIRVRNDEVICHLNWTWIFPYSCRPSRIFRHEFELMVVSNFSSLTTSSKRARLIDLCQTSCFEGILNVRCFHFRSHRLNLCLKKLKIAPDQGSKNCKNFTSDLLDAIDIVSPDFV